MARKIEVEIVGDARSIQRAFGSAGRAGDSFGKKMSGSVGKGLGIVAKGAAGAALAIGGGLAAAIGVGIKGLAEQEKVSSLTAAALKSTGGAAKVTQGEIEGMADKLEKLSGVSAPAIQNGQNLLLTFTGIRNEVGLGNDIFNQATESMLDMSVALGQDSKSSAIQLGKALNDPVKGVSALQRVGVSFTEAQKEQIKAMVEAGDVMGAQKLILGELNKQFGGAAEAVGQTFSGRLEILKARLEDVAEAIAARALPIFERLIAWVEANWPTISAVIQGAANAIFWTLTNVLVPAVRTVIDVVREAVAWVQANWPQISETFNAVTTAISDFVAEHWPPIKTAITEVLSGIKEAIKAFVEAAKTIWSNHGEAIKAVAERIWESIKTTIENFLNLIKGTIKIITGLIKGDWDLAWDGIKQVVGAVLGEIKNKITLAFDGIKAVATRLGEAIWKGIKAGAAELTTILGNLLTGALDKIKSVAENAYNAAKDFGGRVLSGIGDGLSSLASKLVRWIKTPINNVLGLWNDLAIPSFGVDINLPGPVPDISFNSPAISLPDIPLLARGTDFFPGGFAVVGERGPELVQLPRGSAVFPNGAAGPGGMGVTLNVYPSGAAGDSPSSLAAELAWRLRGVT